MTSRKNQQAAREYMRTHPEIAYMEALRRTSGPNTGQTDPISPISPGASRMPFDGREAQAVTAKDHQPSKLFGEHNDYPRLITVVGGVASGKTALLRGWLEQYRNSPAFVLDGGHLMEKRFLGEKFPFEVVEPWPLLTVLNIDMSGSYVKLPAPFDLGAIPRGSLVVLDISFDMASDERHMGHLMDMTASEGKETVSQWVDFYEMLPRLVRKMGITVVVSVDVPDSVPDSAQPGDVVSHLPARLRGGIVVEPLRRFGWPWGAYAVTGPGFASEPSFFVFDAADPAPEAREGLPLLK